MQVNTSSAPGFGDFSFTVIGKQPSLLTRLNLHSSQEENPNDGLSQPSPPPSALGLGAHIAPGPTPTPSRGKPLASMLSRPEPRPSPIPASSSDVPPRSQTVPLALSAYQVATAIPKSLTTAPPDAMTSVPGRHISPTPIPNTNSISVPQPETTMSTRASSSRPSDIYTWLMELTQERSAWDEIRALRQRHREEHTELQRRHEETIRVAQREKEQADRVIALVDTVFDMIETQRPTQERRWAEEKAKAGRAASLPRKLHEERQLAEQQRLRTTSGDVPQQSSQDGMSLEQLAESSTLFSSPQPPTISPSKSSSLAISRPSPESQEVAVRPQNLEVPVPATESIAHTSQVASAPTISAERTAKMFGASITMPRATDGITQSVASASSHPLAAQQEVEKRKAEYDAKRAQVMAEKQRASAEDAQRIRARRADEALKGEGALSASATPVPPPVSCSPPTAALPLIINSTATAQPIASEFTALQSKSKPLSSIRPARSTAVNPTVAILRNREPKVEGDQSTTPSEPQVDATVSESVTKSAAQLNIDHAPSTAPNGTASRHSMKDNKDSDQVVSQSATTQASAGANAEVLDLTVKQESSPEPVLSPAISNPPKSVSAQFSVTRQSDAPLSRPTVTTNGDESSVARPIFNVDAGDRSGRIVKTTNSPAAQPVSATSLLSSLPPKPSTTSLSPTSTVGPIMEFSRPAQPQCAGSPPPRANHDHSGTRPPRPALPTNSDPSHFTADPWVNSTTTGHTPTDHRLPPDRSPSPPSNWHSRRSNEIRSPSPRRGRSARLVSRGDHWSPPQYPPESRYGRPQSLVRKRDRGGSEDLSDDGRSRRRRRSSPVPRRSPTPPRRSPEPRGYARTPPRTLIDRRHVPTIRSPDYRNNYAVDEGRDNGWHNGRAQPWDNYPSDTRYSGSSYDADMLPSASHDSGWATIDLQRQQVTLTEPLSPQWSSQPAAEPPSRLAPPPRYLELDSISWGSTGNQPMSGPSQAEPERHDLSSRITESRVARTTVSSKTAPPRSADAGEAHSSNSRRGKGGRGGRGGSGKTTGRGAVPRSLADRLRDSSSTLESRLT